MSAFDEMKLNQAAVEASRHRQRSEEMRRAYEGWARRENDSQIPDGCVLHRWVEWRQRHVWHGRWGWLGESPEKPVSFPLSHVRVIPKEAP